MSATNLEQRLQDLFRCIREGRILDAMNEFYDKDARMQENANPPTVGLAANIEREKQFLAMVKEWKGFMVTSFGVGDNVTLYESHVDFIAMDGKPVHMEQVAVQKWRNDKIVSERFYYDTGGAAKA
jgi:hypothetical protein